MMNHGRPTVPFQASTPGNPGRVGEDSARPRAALRFRRSQDHKRVILAEPDCPNRRVSNRVTMVPAGSKPGTSDYVDDFLRDERESFKRKETSAKKFDNRLDNFRKSAQALRDAARQFEEAFPGMSRTMIADKLAMTGTEKNIAFDAKGELVAAPAGRKTVSAEPTVAPAADAATDPETTGSDVQEADDEPAPQEPAAEPDTSDDGRPAWASGNY